MEITFTYNKKTGRWKVPIEQHATVKAHNKQPVDSPDHFMEHMRSSVLDKYFGNVVDRLLEAGYTVIRIEDEK